MYVVKVLHGYITPTGHRMRLKSESRLYKYKLDTDQLATKIGGRVKKINLERVAL